ncbi:MAG: peptidase domain-containing ABC transporter [Bacteroidetes bacterium]|nr:peptidase domain-containing ABC transporter [Bacteroidota bacterium]
MGFPVYLQMDAKDCGPSCLRMIARHYGKSYSLQTLREKSYITREGVSLLGISDAAESIGFRSMGVQLSFKQLIEDVPLPCIVHWKHRHFVVVHGISKKRKKVMVADPGHGLLEYSFEEFLQAWTGNTNALAARGVALLLEPTPDFYSKEEEKISRVGFGYLLRYIKPQKQLIFQLILGLVLASLLQLIFPFLTQAIVDKGIVFQDIDFIYLILIAQLVLMASRTSVDFIRNWILLHLSARINISLISDFLIKLMKLPIGFFDTRLIGDIMQRIGDHGRIQNFLTGPSLAIIYGAINLVVFGFVLSLYQGSILLVFILGSLVYFFWIYLFLKKRRSLDFRKFEQMADNQNNLYQIITGMQEIKLNNCEKQKRWKWETIQAKLFRVNAKSLALSQYQQLGGLFFNETKNILITFLAASAVLKGEMTLGMMVAVQYIIGQLNGPIDQMVGFIQSAQDARISLERLGEIHGRDDEESGSGAQVHLLPEHLDIQISGLSFQYEGPHSPFALKDINLKIPQGKVTAIVGSSGSGKTTLVKLLLGFFPVLEGEIRVGEIRLENINQRVWRNLCGAVMQEGFIFSDTITENVATGAEEVDRQRLYRAVKMANIQDFVENLPLGYNTLIGQEGSGLSQGQKQRILIARAIYKDPSFLFFDEATNALDAENELVIMQNLNEVFHGKTVVIVAHRLSTVKNADQIIVLDKGALVEQGNHESLVKRQGKYYQLVKNQLELGS